MSEFENVPAATLVDAVEKFVARSNDAELASSLQGGLASMPMDSVHALVSSIFEAFRDRGESSEDAAEGAHASLDALAAGDPAAVAALVGYARENAGLLKDALVMLAERHGAYLHMLPSVLVRPIAQQLAAAPHP
jgi:hypothetical protein